jgi:oxygen-dependent protoporphyrinogen oxidase
MFSPDSSSSFMRGDEPDEEPASLAPTRVLVIGGGIAGLVAARDIARPGFAVTVLEAADVVGGSVATHEVAGIRLDAGAESFATRGGAVAQLISDLGLDDAVVQPNPAGAWLRLADRTVPLPKAGLLGIPSSPLATDVVRAIGWGGALRAYLDRIMPVMKIGHERNLGQLVRRRMGRAVHDRLVAPVASGVYSAQPDELDIAVVAPGLNSALTRQGSLSGAVMELRGAAKAGSAVGGLRGGMSRLVDELVSQIEARGGTIRTGARVESLTPAGLAPLTKTTEKLPESAENDPNHPESSISPSFSTGVEGEEGGNGAEAGRWRVGLAGGESLWADAVLVALPGGAALRVLSGASADAAHLAELDWPEASSVELATLVLDAPALDSAPRGTGLLVAEDAQGEAAGSAAVTAKALTHATAKWLWLAEAAGSGRHVLRLSYGRAGEPSRTAGLDDDTFGDLALKDAATLLDIPLQASAVLGFARTRWTNALPFAALGQRERIAAVRSAINDIDGLEVCGAWLTGTGLASVVPDTREAARRIRGLRWKALT